MAKKNKKGGGQANHQEKTPEVVRRWNDYFGRGELSDWQRLCHDLGRDGNLTSKTQCRKVRFSRSYYHQTSNLTV